MWKLLLTLIAFSFIFSCSVDEPMASDCAVVTGFKANQAGSTLSFEWDSHSDAVDFEISYSRSATDKSADKGEKIKVINATSVQKSLFDLYLAYEYYDFYVRAKCSEGYGLWSEKVRVEIQELCFATEDVEISTIYSHGPMLQWESGNELPPVKYEVNYGISGFTAGTGTSLITNNTSTIELVMNGRKTYDFYVREQCQKTNAWSDWSEPASFYSSKDNFICREPSNLYGEVIEDNYSTLVLSLDWENYGLVEFEYALPEEGYLPRSYNTYSVDLTENGWPEIEVDRNFIDLYVRAKCLDGSFTDWAGPYTIDDF